MCRFINPYKLLRVKTSVAHSKERMFLDHMSTGNTLCWDDVLFRAGK